jgi:di/tricarboxylate transporter
MALIDLYMWFIFSLILISVIFFSIERIPIEITSIGIITLLVIIFQNSPFLGVNSGIPLSLDVVLKGFANPALLALMSLLVIGHGLLITGALENIAVWVSGDKSKNTQIKFLSVMFLVFILSALLNNTPIIIMFIPIILSLCKQLKRSERLILIPLSYVCILGGMTTLIGSSTNLLVSGSVFSILGKEIGFFDFAKQGIFLALIGFFYATFILPLILKFFNSGENEETDNINDDGKQYLVQVEIAKDNPLLGKTFISGLLPGLESCTIRLITRDNVKLIPPFDDLTIKNNDQLTITITKGNLTDSLKRNDPIFQTLNTVELSSKTEMMLEASITPGSFLIGRTLSQTNFENDSNCSVIGIQRNRNADRESLQNLKLNAGDNFLLRGSEESLRSLRGIKDIFPIEWSAIYLPSKHLAARARLIFLLTIFLASTGLFNIAAAAVMGATLMLIFKVISVRDAISALDLRIYLLVASTIMLSIALQETGGAMFISDTIIETTSGLGITSILSILFLTVAIITNFISNNATAVLFTPIAISMSLDLNMQPEPFIYCVLFAANCSFATPIGYQTNLMVMGPGNYKFKDFLISGIPLILIIWVSYSFMINYFGI